MKFRIEQLYDAVNALVTINNTPKMIPSMAKYKLARMHDRLEPTFKEYEKKRIALIQTHGEEQFQDAEKTKSIGWGVQPGTPGFTAYTKAFDALLAEEVEIEVLPIMTMMLGNDPKGLEMSEFKQLGDLIVYNNPE